MKSTVLQGTKFVNLCPHDVTLINGNGMKLVFKASGHIARMENTSERTSLTVGIAEGLELEIPILQCQDKGVYGLPEPQENTIYITSYIIAKEVKRTDVISPLTNETAVRDDDGRIQGVRGFQSFS